jgi:hypothetical protein
MSSHHQVNIDRYFSEVEKNRRMGRLSLLDEPTPEMKVTIDDQSESVDVGAIRRDRSEIVEERNKRLQALRDFPVEKLVPPHVRLHYAELWRQEWNELAREEHDRRERRFARRLQRAAYRLADRAMNALFGPPPDFKPMPQPRKFEG